MWQIHSKTKNPLYNTVYYSIVLNIRQFKDGPQKCCIQTKMYRLYRKMTIYTCLFSYNKICIQTKMYRLYIKKARSSRLPI